MPAWRVQVAAAAATGHIDRLLVSQTAAAARVCVFTYTDRRKEAFEAHTLCRRVAQRSCMRSVPHARSARIAQRGANTEHRALLSDGSTIADQSISPSPSRRPQQLPARARAGSGSMWHACMHAVLNSTVQQLRQSESMHAVRSAHVGMEPRMVLPPANIGLAGTSAQRSRRVSDSKSAALSFGRSDQWNVDAVHGGTVRVSTDRAALSQHAAHA